MVTIMLPALFSWMERVFISGKTELMRLCFSWIIIKQLSFQKQRSQICFMLKKQPSYIILAGFLLQSAQPSHDITDNN